jgi:sugar-specific transcriptional regulator TrmB
LTANVGEEAKKVLSDLGLTSYETQAYSALVEKGAMAASQVSEHSNVPYSKIYETLNSLEKKGWIETKTGRPTQYYPKSPSEALQAAKLHLREKMKSWEHIMKRELQPLYEQREFREKPDIWILRGEHNVLAKLKEMLVRARRELMVAIPKFTKDLAVVGVSMLHGLRDQGVEFLFMAGRDAFGPEVLERMVAIGKVRVRDGMFGGGVIVDGKEALLLLGEEKPTLVIWSNHLGLVKFARDYFQFLWETAEEI